MKRGFPQKIEPLLPQSLGKDALDALMELATATSAGKSPSEDVLNQIRCLRPEDIASVVQQAGGAAWVDRYLTPILANPDCQRRLQTSAAVVGLALSMGAADILSLMRNQALAAEVSPTELTESQRADELATELQKLAESASSAIELGSLDDSPFGPTQVSARPTAPVQTGGAAVQTLAVTSANASYHIVQSGETVFSLARSYGVSPAQIVSLNRLKDASGIKSGQMLQVPDSATQAADPAATVVAQPPAAQVQLSQLKPYQVQQGDTLESIARSYDITRADIVALNQLSDPNDLKVNQTIALPRDAQLSRSGSVKIASASAQPTEETLPVDVSLPEPPQSVSAVQPKPSAVNPSASRSSELSTYRVQPGDTLARISRKTGTPLRELSRLNGISNPNFIFVGQSLKVHAAASSPVRQTVERPTVVASRPESNSSVASKPAKTRVGPESSHYVDSLMSEIRQMRQDLRSENKGVEQALPQPLIPDLAREAETPNQATAPAASQRVAETAKQPSRYLDGLKAELRELQSERQSVVKTTDSGASDVGASDVDAPQSINVELPPIAKTQPQPNSGAQVVAAAPLGSQSYEPLAQSLLSRSVSPELPPLLSEPFMPDGALNGYIWPAEGVFTSGFGWRWGRMHKGIDIAAPVGTPIVAAASGVVTYSGWGDGYGNLVEITHKDGSVTLYAHNSRNLVREGQRVRQGQQIAEMGSTGFSTGPHLHFEIHAVGRGAVNPTSLLPAERD